MLSLLKILRYTHIAVYCRKLLLTALLMLLLLLLSLRNIHDGVCFLSFFLSFFLRFAGSSSCPIHIEYIFLAQS